MLGSCSLCKNLMTGGIKDNFAMREVWIWVRPAFSCTCNSIFTGNLPLSLLYSWFYPEKYSRGIRLSYAIHPTYYISSTRIDKKNKLRGLSPLATYANWATVAYRRSKCQLLRIEGAMWSAWLIPTAVFSDFWTRAAPQLYSRGWVDPVPDPLHLRESGSAGNRTQTSGYLARNSDHWTTEVVTGLGRNEDNSCSLLAPTL
jgi:hypothetical protein